jgi:cytoskeletal protein CcmA (bactofilin family)
MFQKKEMESHFDVVIGPNSLIKGDIESEGSIRVDGKIIGNITSLGNVIISENAFVQGDITCVNSDIYGKCEGNVKVKGKINIHQNSSLVGDILARSFSTKEGSVFKGNCVVNPEEELVITIESTQKSKDVNLVDFTKSNNHDKNKKQTNEKQA